MPLNRTEQQDFREAAKVLGRNASPERLGFRDSQRTARFLKYLVEHYPVMLHGSTEAGLNVLEPRTKVTARGVPSSLLFATTSLPYVVAWATCKAIGLGQMFDFDYSASLFGRVFRLQMVSLNRLVYASCGNASVPVYICPAEPFRPFHRQRPPPVERLTLGAVRRCPVFYTKTKVVPLGWVEVAPSALPYVSGWHEPADGKGMALLRNLFRIASGGGVAPEDRECVGPLHARDLL
jgi:hypothetical protein